MGVTPTPRFSTLGVNDFTHCSEILASWCHISIFIYNKPANQPNLCYAYSNLTFVINFWQLIFVCNYCTISSYDLETMVFLFRFKLFMISFCYFSILFRIFTSLTRRTLPFKLYITYSFLFLIFICLWMRFIIIYLFISWNNIWISLGYLNQTILHQQDFIDINFLCIRLI